MANLATTSVAQDATQTLANKIEYIKGVIKNPNVYLRPIRGINCKEIKFAVPLEVPFFKAIYNTDIVGVKDIRGVFLIESEDSLYLNINHNHLSLPSDKFDEDIIDIIYNHMSTISINPITHEIYKTCINNIIIYLMTNCVNLDANIKIMAKGLAIGFGYNIDDVVDTIYCSYNQAINLVQAVV